MSSCLWAILAAALALALAAPATAQIPPDPGAAANVRQSEQYDKALRSNPSFRAKRMQEECGPINDPQLHQQCVASFQDDQAPRATKKRQQ